MADTVTLSREQFDAISSNMAIVKEAAVAFADDTNRVNKDTVQTMIKDALAAQQPRRKTQFDDGSDGTDTDGDLVSYMEDDADLNDPREVERMRSESRADDRHFRRTKRWKKSVQEAHDLAYLVNVVMGGKAQKSDGYGSNYRFSQNTRIGKSWNNMAERARIKAMADGNAGSGAEFLFTGYSANMVEKIYMARRVAGLFYNQPLPTDPFTFPVEGADITPYLTGENTSDTPTKYTAATPGTNGKLTFTTKKIAVRSLYSAEVEEDSLVAIAPYMERKYVRAFGDAEESMLMNGDDTGTHMDSDTTASTDVRKAFKGLRKLALAQAATKMDVGAAGGWSLDNSRKIRQLMQRYGVLLSDLSWVMSINAYFAALAFTELKTLVNYGPMATILTGELGKLDSIPVIVSEFARQDLNASGVYDGTTTTKTAVQLVYRPTFAIGERRSMRLISDRSLYVESDQIVTVASRRWTFQPLRPVSAADPAVVIGYNI